MNDMQTNNNIVLVCKDCGNQFVFTEGEQSYYLKNKLVEPKRCPPCRRIKKLLMEAK